MKIKTLLAFVSCAAIIAVALLSGCETESADAAGVTVSPDYTKLTKAGQTVTLTASGWNNFTWKCEPTGKGVLSGATGKSVVFTAVDAGTVTVTATPIASGTSSNGVYSVSSGSAIVVIEWSNATTNKPSASENKSSTSNSVSPNVSISPNYKNLTEAGQTVKLTASGWDDFTWKCVPSDKGVLSGTTGKSVVYTAAKSGTVTVTATPIVKGGSSTTSGTAMIVHEWGGQTSTTNQAASH